MSPRRGERRQQILECLARELEANPGSRITTAALARSLAVSEAALYRHFPSKAKMFEGLIEFAEETVFTRVTRILADEADPIRRCDAIVRLLLGFAERNPGISRILLGDALAGENERLRARVAQLFERVETQLRQILREANLSNGPRPRIAINAVAALLLAVVEGRLSRYVRSGFKASPTEGFDELWPALCASCFVT